MFKERCLLKFLVLVGIMVLFLCIPLMVNAEESPASDFNFDPVTGTITKYIGTATEVYIPVRIGGIEVTSIGEDAFFGCSSLTNINIPNTVTSIGGNAFGGCSSLTNIYIPDSVVNIGWDIFNRCNNIAVYGYVGSDVQRYLEINYPQDYYPQEPNIYFEVVREIKIGGYILPDFQYRANSSFEISNSFRADVIWKQTSVFVSAYTTNELYSFELSVPNYLSGCNIKISKPGFLTKEIKKISLSKNVQPPLEGTWHTNMYGGRLELFPISIWAGDINGDNAINMTDIMEVAKLFNSIPEDGKYNEVIDFNKDGAINIQDIMIAANHFNATSESY